MDLSPKWMKRVGLGKYAPKKTKRRRPRNRTMATFLNKQKKLKTLYGRLFRKSKRAKEKENNPDKTYFCDKFPTYESYAKNYNLKQIQKAEPRVSRSTTTTRRKGIWGM